MLSQLNKDQLIEKYCIAIVFVMKLWCRLKDDSGFRSILKVTLELAVKIAGGHYISHMTLIPSDNINKMQWKNKLNIVVDQKHNRNEKLWIKPGRSYQSAGLRAKHSFSRFYTLNIWHNLTVTENLDYVYMVKITVDLQSPKCIILEHIHGFYQKLGESKKWYCIRGFAHYWKQQISAISVFEPIHELF